MSYLIDTDWVIDFLLGQDEATATLRALRPHGIGISVISYMEVIEGIAGSSDPRRAMQVFRAFLRGTRMFVVGRAVAERAADIRAGLRMRNRPVEHRVLDLLIAATAVEHDLILVTRNVRHFSDIPDLQLYQS